MMSTSSSTTFDQWQSTQLAQQERRLQATTRRSTAPVAPGDREVYIQHAATGHSVGAGVYSNMGMPVPVASPLREAHVSMILIPTNGNDYYRIQSTQKGLDRLDHWFYASDVRVPSIIYRDILTNNNMEAFLFRIESSGNGTDGLVHIQSAKTGEYVEPSDCNRLVLTPHKTANGVFRVILK